LGLLRLVATLVIAGLALLVLAVALTLQVASAAPGGPAYESFASTDTL
jgi:hypothetical protein